jgi:hypothetical protein
LFPALGLFLLLLAPLEAQRGPVNISGTWKVETQGSKGDTTLTLKQAADKLDGTLKTPYGEFALENGNVDGLDIFFNVLITRDDYKLKTSYRGHLYNNEIQFSVEAGERTLQVIAKKVTQE